jgi:hypothetical protein
VKTRTQVLFAMAIAGTLAVLTAVVLLSGSVSVAIWMEGPYFPLTLLVPGSVDTLPTMVVVVGAYYFVASLVGLRCSSWRGLVVVVSIVVAVNTLGALTWHRQAHRSGNAHGRTGQYVVQPDRPYSSAADGRAAGEGMQRAAQQADAADEAQGGTRTAS